MKFFVQINWNINPEIFKTGGLLTSTLYNGFIYNFTDIRKQSK